MLTKSIPADVVPMKDHQDLAPLVSLDQTKPLIFVSTSSNAMHSSTGALLLLDGHYRVTAVTMAELFSLRNVDPFPLVVLNDHVGPSELVAAAQFVRAQWPKARILVLGQAAHVLTDNLYDDSLAHACEQDGLLETLANLSFDPWKHRVEGRPFVVRNA